MIGWSLLVIVSDEDPFMNFKKMLDCAPATPFKVHVVKLITPLAWKGNDCSVFTQLETEYGYKIVMEFVGKLFNLNVNKGKIATVAQRKLKAK